jgi:ribosome recycling factor
MDAILASFKEHFDKVLEHYHHELSSVRTGRANPALLSTVMVESYGTHVPLQQVANTSVSDAKTLVISPWDKSTIPAIEKGIMTANLGFNPSNDGVVIRITLPALTEERRRDMVKLVSQMAEQARIGVRQVREDVIKAFKKAEADGVLTQDGVTAGQKKLQDVVDKLNADIKAIAADKEQELMTV